jgi:SAM-dependent methyltransferase
LKYFSPKTAAERYVKGRPFFHPLVIGRVKEFLSPPAPLPLGLDVCCGTGLSSVALKELAAEVVGVDASPEMLAFAPSDSGILFCLADAENLPFAEGAFDIVTVSQAIHWLDKRRFMAEARRVLRAGGWLVVYDDYMTGRVVENEDFRAWFKGAYLERFPAPPRDWPSFTADEAEGEGFRLCLDERFENRIGFSLEGLISFVTSHSNVIAAVEGEGREIGEVRAWLAENMRPFFGQLARAHFVFEAAVWCLRRGA